MDAHEERTRSICHRARETVVPVVSLVSYVKQRLSLHARVGVNSKLS